MENEMQKKDAKRCFQTMKQNQLRREEATHQNFMSYGVDNYDDQSSSSSVSDTGSEQDWASPTGAKKGRMGQGYGVMSSEASSANYMHASAHQEPSVSRKSPSDDDRRKVRRERNKVAAARCRQRRVDLTNSLIAETEALENEKVKLEKELDNLYRQTHELQFVLESHSKRCQMINNTTNADPSDLLTTPVDLTAIKVEKPDAKFNSGNRTVGHGMGRPTSLPINSSIATKTLTNMPFSSSTGMPCPLTLDFMADGHTGLTPITGLPSATEVPLPAECLGGPNPTLIDL